MKLTEALEQIVDSDAWYQDESGAWNYEGEVADSIPTWCVSPSDCSGYILKRTIGWYEQQGDAEDEVSLVRLARGMDAAERALNTALAKPQPTGDRPATCDATATTATAEPTGSHPND